jgi:UPF0716 protein FxsA
MTITFPMRLAFVLYVVIEVALFVLGVRWLGGAAVFVWVLATAGLGVVLVRREGIRAIETMRAAVRERRAPDRTVPDRGMVATGGLLLMLPGLLTDLVGLVMVIPATRPFARRLLTVLASALVGRVGRAALVRPADYPHRQAPGPVQPGQAPGPVVRGEVLDSRDDLAD